jgi:hypothetical protein
MHFPRDFRSTIRRDTPSTGDAQMLLSHAMVSVASVCFGLSAAFAQQPAQMANSGVKLPTCAQSLIEREWLANFYLAQVNHGFSCPIGISSDASITYVFTDDQWGARLMSPFPYGALRTGAGCLELDISFVAIKSGEFRKIGLFRLS